QLSKILIVIAGDLIFPAAVHIVWILFHMLCNCTQREQPSSHGEFLLDINAVANEVYRTIVIYQRIDCLFAKNLLFSIAHSHFSNFSNETVHAFETATISSNNFFADFL